MAIAPPAPATPITLNTEDLTTISCAANRLVGHFGFREQDREDVEHDLVVDLLERLPNYNPAKAKRSTFAKDCVEHKISKMIRASGRQCRDPRRIQHFGLGDEDVNDEGAVAFDGLLDPRSQDDQRRADLRMDVAEVVAGLTPRQQEICALLPEHTPHAISKKLGLSKREVYGAVEIIRSAFARVGLDEGFSPAGKSSCPAG